MVRNAVWSGCILNLSQGPVELVCHQVKEAREIVTVRAVLT